MAFSKSMSARSGGKIRKVFCKILADLGLRITVQSYLKVVNYLDVTINLTNGKRYTCRRHDNNPLYINAKSNYPPSIIRQLPTLISSRISTLSCNEDEFNKITRLYNDALKSTGYHENIRYVKNQDQGLSRKRNRSRKIISFNAPYSQNVETNVAKTFLRLIDKRFPKSHKLHKIFNKNNLKVSYSCPTNSN